MTEKEETHRAKVEAEHDSKCYVSAGWATVPRYLVKHIPISLWRYLLMRLIDKRVDFK